MATQVDTESQKFCDNVRRYIHLWDSVEIKSVLAKIEERWKALFADIILSCEEKDFFKKSYLCTEKFRFIRVTQHVNGTEINRLLDGLVSNNINIMEEFVELPFNQYKMSELTVRDWEHKFGIESRWPLFKLYSNNITLDSNKLWNELQAHVRREGPYETIQDALQELVSIDDHNFHVSVIAPKYTPIIEKLEVNDNRLSVSIKAHRTIDPVKVRLNLIMQTTEGKERQKYDFCKDDAHEVGNIMELKREIQLQKPRRLYFMLFHDGLEVDLQEKLIEPEDTRLGIYAVFDKDLEILRSWLNGDGKDKHDFEWAVHALMHLSGFSVLFLGYAGNKLQSKTKGLGEPDILAYDDVSKRVLAIDCTTSAKDLFGTISSNYSRARELSKRLLDYEVLSTVFVDVRRDEVHKGLKDIVKEDSKITYNEKGVALITKDEMNKILDLVNRGENVNSIYNFILSNTRK